MTTINLKYLTKTILSFWVCCRFCLFIFCLLTFLRCSMTMKLFCIKLICDKFKSLFEGGYECGLFVYILDDYNWVSFKFGGFWWGLFIIKELFSTKFKKKKRYLNFPSRNSVIFIGFFKRKKTYFFIYFSLQLHNIEWPLSFVLTLTWKIFADILLLYLPLSHPQTTVVQTVQYQAISFFDISPAIITPPHAYSYMRIF